LNKEVFDENIKMVNRVREIAEREKCDTSALSLAWLIRQGDNIATIPGTTKFDNFSRNWSAIELAERLDQTVIDELSEISKNGFLGERYEGNHHYKPNL